MKNCIYMYIWAIKGDTRSFGNNPYDPLHNPMQFQFNLPFSFPFDSPLLREILGVKTIS